MRHPGLRMAGRQGVAGRLLAVFVIVVVGSAAAHADGDCTEAFEKWSKQSTTRMRTQTAESGAQSAGGAAQKEACLPSEAMRQELLLGLARTRTTCDAAPWLDQAAKQTKEMIDINAGVIGSVAICRSETPRSVEAEPVAPRPAPRPRACLDIAQVDPERFTLSNRKCSGSTVLAVIEKRGPSGKVDCKGYTIDRRLTVATLKDARPQINYECVLAQGNCSKDHVATIFPECDW